MAPDLPTPRQVASSDDVRALRSWATGQHRIALAMAPDHRLAFAAADGTSWEVDSRRVGLASAALTTVAQSGAYLWAYDATSLYRALVDATGLAIGGIRCAQTAGMTHRPVVGETRANLHTPGNPDSAASMAIAVAQLVETIHAEACPMMRRHILADVRTDDLWRRPSRGGYAVDEDALETEAQLVKDAQQRSVDLFGDDLTSDHLALAWMAERGITCTDAGEPTCGFKKLPEADVPPGMSEDWAEFVALRDVARGRNIVKSLKRNLCDGRVHPRINAVGAVTGRMSITSPAMQATPGRLRHLFSADPGMTLVACDLDRVEPCLVAAASGDPGLVAAAKLDIYKELAVSVWGESARGDEDRRAQAKTALNAITYGQGATSLARRLGVPVEDAQAIIDGWEATYPQFHQWIKEVTTTAENGDPLTTLTGRNLPTPTKPSRTSFRAPLPTCSRPPCYASPQSCHRSSTCGCPFTTSLSWPYLTTPAACSKPSKFWRPVWKRKLTASASPAHQPTLAPRGARARRSDEKQVRDALLGLWHDDPARRRQA